MANIVDRVKNILITPKTEWDVIEAETTPTQQLIVGYVLPLAAIAALCAYIGLAVIGQSLGPFGHYRIGMVAALSGFILQMVMSVLMVFLVGFIIDALAPTFGATKNMDQARKVAAYSYTPAWVVGVLSLLPALSLLGILGALYGIYLLYLGLPKLMKAPAEKAAGYTAVVIVVAIVLGFIFAAIVGAVTTMMSPSIGGMGMGVGGRPAVVFDKDSPAGKMGDFAQKMEEASKKMEAAQKSGDPNKSMEAAMGALGTVISGGKGVEPVQLEALKPLLPTTLVGLPRTSESSDRSGVPGLMAAKVQGEYADPSGKRVELEIVDTGGAAGLMAIAAFAQGEREDANHMERTRREGTRLVHEEVSKKGGRNKFTVVLADRFVVSAEGSGVDISALKSAVGSVDLGKLESMK